MSLTVHYNLRLYILKLQRVGCTARVSAYFSGKCEIIILLPRQNIKSRLDFMQQIARPTDCADLYYCPD